MNKRHDNTFLVAFDTAIETVELFDYARALDPGALSWVRSLRSVSSGTGRTLVTVAIARDHYASVLAGMDGVVAYVPLAIEQELLAGAWDVIDELDPDPEPFNVDNEKPIIPATAEPFCGAHDDDYEIPF